MLGPDSGCQPLVQAWRDKCICESGEGSGGCGIDPGMGPWKDIFKKAIVLTRSKNGSFQTLHWNSSTNTGNKNQDQDLPASLGRVWAGLKALFFALCFVPGNEEQPYTSKPSPTSASMRQPRQRPPEKTLLSSGALITLISKLSLEVCSSSQSAMSQIVGYEVCEITHSP